MPNIIKEEIVLCERPQICGSSMAESVKYFVHKGKSGKRYLVGDVPEAADYVYMEGGPNSNGFGGREITFPLVEGGELVLKGPWKISSSELFEATGVDVRGTMPASYVIAITRENRKSPVAPWISNMVMVGVLFEDDRAYSPRERRALGMEQPHTIARRFADELGHSVQIHYETISGGSTGPVNPTDPATGKEGRYVSPPK